ncbi:MAG: hypothetical protein ACXADY_06930 [Candidatus Hodarchaeales archaeon]|jgi:hypothetical protein
MSNTNDYTAWFCNEMKKLIDLIANQTYRINPQELNVQIQEIQRGVEYGNTNPGAIDQLLLKMGRNIVDSLQVYARQMRPKTPTGIPPGGKATVFSGLGEVPPSGGEVQSQNFSVDELKGALASRKKKKVVGKMKGSLDLLKEYDES